MSIWCYTLGPEHLELRVKLIHRLRKTRGIEVVAIRGEADAIITGTGEIWLKGYANNNPKPSPYNRQPIYDEYLSLELQGKGNATSWSYRVTQGKFQWNDGPQDLVNRLVKSHWRLCFRKAVRSSD